MLYREETEENRVVIVGGGTMGANIAAIFLAGGMNVYVVVKGKKGRRDLSARVKQSLRACDNGVHDFPFRILGSLTEIPWEEIDLVVECVNEQLPLKQDIFNQLEALSNPRTPLTSNSSSFPISLIGHGLETQNRMLGLHFFMPAHYVPLVEVVCSKLSEVSVAEAVFRMMERLGKVPILVKRDIAGFIANRIQHALMREAISLVESGIASVEDVDKAVRYGFGFRFIAGGPLLQKDLSGLDVNLAAATTIYRDLCNSPYPSPELTDKVERGDLGAKTGKGFYVWTQADIDRTKVAYEKMLKAALRIMQEE
jgi:3-hydroxybutyryl-CoA dehydrogenase